MGVSPLAWLGVFLRGFAMGAADAVPGVSGGTIALITGIYERLVDAVAAVSEAAPEVLADARSLAGRGGWATLQRHLVRADVPFLLVLGAGVVTGALSLANVLEWAQTAHPVPTFAFFFGLILASPWVVRGEVSLRRRPAIAGLVGFAVAFVVSGLPAGTATAGVLLLVPVGAVAICAMVLPGVSGALILLTLGQYHHLTGAVSDLTAGLGALLLGGGPARPLVDPLTTLVAFSAGALVGLFTFARVVSWALDAYRVTTMTLLVGVMIGALRAPARRVLAGVDAWGTTAVAAVVVAGAAGVLAVLALDAVSG